MRAHFRRVVFVTSLSIVAALTLAVVPSFAGPYYTYRVAEGLYEIQPASTSAMPTSTPPRLWLTLQTPSTTLGTRVVIGNWSTHSSLRWRLREESVHQPGGVGGSRIVAAYRITNLHSGKCLDIKGPARANYTAVHQWGCKGGATSTNDLNASQLWKVTRDSSGRSELINAYGHRCLDIPEFRAHAGRLMQIWSCSGAWNQAFRLKKVG